MDGKNLLHRVAGALGATLLIAASAVALTPSTAAGASGSFTVDDPTDAADAAIDGTCATAGGTCTLRAAVQEADAAGGTTDIGFAPSADTSSLSISGSGGAEVGDLDITSGVTVRLTGNHVGPDATTLIKADAMGDRHFHVQGGGRLEVVDVTLAGGHSTDDGGAILNDGSVLIQNRLDTDDGYPALQSNRADHAGGAIANTTGADLKIANVSEVTTGSTRIDVTGNTAKYGGAIANMGGSVTIVGSAGEDGGPSHDVYVDSNGATEDGGGVWNQAGDLTLGCRAYIRFSSANTGGDLHNEGTATLDGGGLDGGAATTAGGAAFNDSTGTIAVPAAPVGDTCGAPVMGRSKVSAGNGGQLYNKGAVTIADGGQLALSGDGSGPDATDGAGLYQEDGTITVSGVLSISSPNAQGAGGGILLAAGSITTDGAGRLLVGKAHANSGGGAVRVDGGTFTVSMIADSNDTFASGGGLEVTGGTVGLDRSAIVNGSAGQSGGAISVSGGTAVVQNTTVARNLASTSGGGVAVSSGGATLRHVTVVDNSTGIDGVPAGPPVVQRSLLARNNGQDCTGTVTLGDFDAVDDGSCATTGTDLTDPDRLGDVGDDLSQFGELDSFAYTPTSGNPAIDLVTDGGCGTPAVDQEGSTRPQDGDGDGTETCDAGAIEAVAAPLAAERSIRGHVASETTHLPMSGVCVFAGRTDGSNGDGNDHMAMTDGAGDYVHELPAGHYLLAFFLPAGGARSVKDCGGDDGELDMSVQPEWYRNVPVQLKDPGDPGSDVEFPSLSDVSLVDVTAVDAAGIDACLGPGPDAGEDAPCPVAASEAAAPPAPATTVPPPSTGSGSHGSTPARLAFTGTNLSGVWLGLVLIGAGAAMAIVAARRPRRLLAR